MQEENIMKKKMAILILAGGIAAAGLAGCGQRISVQPAETADMQSKVGQNEQRYLAQNTQTSSQANGITVEDAKSIALNQAGISEQDTIAVTAYQDFDDGFQYYEVVLYTPDVDYEYEISITDGTVLKNEMKQNCRTADIQSQTSVTPDAARDIVLQKVPGAADDHLRMKLDFDDGRYTYEGEVIYNGTEYEFEIDAQTGELYQWEQKVLQL